MRTNLASSVLKTLSYAEIFQYPMKFQELWKYFIAKEPVSKRVLKEYLLMQNQIINKKDGYYFLEKDHIVRERKERNVSSRKKIEIALYVASVLSSIPFIKLIGISGSLSVLNSRQCDDIDLFIVTSKGRLWVTRFLVTMTLMLLRKKRKRKDFNTRDKICPNMYISCDNLSISKNEQNLFMAHEITQLRVCLNKDNTYEKFLAENIWVLKYLPNSISIKKIKPFLSSKEYGQNAGKKWLSNSLLSFIEKIAFFLQFSYMRRHITCERIERNIAKFHPDNKKEKILSLYKKKYNFYFRKAGILLFDRYKAGSFEKRRFQLLSWRGLL